MNRIALHHIETLLWIARLGTFSAAADRMNTSQPSVSTRMRELEHIVGEPLFQREGRRMLFTVRGRQLVGQLEPLWFEIESTLKPRDSAGNLSGIIKIGCGEIAAVRCLPEFVGEIGRSMPNLCLEVEVDLTINLRHKLESGHLDLAIMVGPVDSQALLCQSIGRVAMHWFISRALYEKAPVKNVAELMTRWPIWCLSRPSHLYEYMTAAFRQAQFRASSINTCNNVRTLIDIIRKDGGVAILPEILVQEWIKAGDLVRLEDSRFDASVEFVTAIRRSEGDPAALEMFKRSCEIVLA